MSQNIFGFTNAQLEKFGCTANNNFVQTVHIDSRSIFQTISDLGNSVNSNSHKMVELGNIVNSLTEEIKMLKNSIAEIKTMLTSFSQVIPISEHNNLEEPANKNTNK